MQTTLTKKDVAQKQLVTAIRLFFNDDDPISIFSLAANAWEIIDVLCNKANIQSISNQMRQNISNGQDLKKDYINSPFRNFFKHADKDSDRVIENFDETIVDSIIFLGVEDYLRLINKSPVEFQVFQLWYLATNPEKISYASLKEILDTINHTFQNINQLSRKEQLQMGKAVLLESMKDKELMLDDRTEKTNNTQLEAKA